MSRARALLGEPLMHFAVLGAIVFCVWRWAAPSDEHVVVIERARVDVLVDAWTKQHGAAPDAAQRRRFVESLATEEILMREARQLGLDRSDPIVQRRLSQKMRFVLEDEGASGAASVPTDAQLLAFLEANAADYARPEHRDFVQIFVGPELAEVQGRLDTLEQQLAEGAAADTLGLPFAHGHRFESRTHVGVAKLFGPAFADALIAAPAGAWTRLRSTYGWHLVKAAPLSAAGVASLDEVRGQVTAAWGEGQRAARFELALQRLRAQYEVREGPEPGFGGTP